MEVEQRLEELTYKDQLNYKMKMFFTPKELQQEVSDYLISLGVDKNDAKRLSQNNDNIIRLIRESIAYSHFDKTKPPKQYTINAYEIKIE